MYFVGIDVSKFKHDCAIIDELGNVITPSWSFQNDYEGFSFLRELLDALDGKKKIGLEATGHYGQNLKLFLENNSFSFMEFNPLLINRFVRSKSLRKTKTDSIDALMIAQYLMTVEYKPYPPSFYTLEKLKSLTRFRDSLIRQRSRQLVELTNILDKVFPEFKPFFKGRFSATALYILSHYASPEKISNMNSKSYESLRRLSRGKFSMLDFVELKTLARNTVGSTSDYLLQEMEIIIDIYSQLQSKVEEVEQQINECVLGLDPPILTVPGIGALSAAVALSIFHPNLLRQSLSKFHFLLLLSAFEESILFPTYHILNIGCMASVQNDATFPHMRNLFPASTHPASGIHSYCSIP